jgi:hypothetical protein
MKLIMDTFFGVHLQEPLPYAKEELPDTTSDTTLCNWNLNTEHS